MRCALVVLIAASSVADAAPVRLEISGTACSLDRLQAKVEQLAPGLSFDADATTRIPIAIRATSDGVIGRISIDGVREVHAATCDELTESLALILAMAFPRPSEPAPVALEHVDTAPIPSPRTPPAWSVFGGGAGSWTSEGWVARAIVGGRWRHRDRSLAVEVRVSSPTDDYVNDASKIRIWDAALSLAPCVHLGALAACAGVAGGFIRGTSSGLADARSRTSPMLSMGGRLEWTIPVWGRIGLRMHLDGDVYLSTTRFDVDHMTRWSHDRVEVRGGFGAVAYFP